MSTESSAPSSAASGATTNNTIGDTPGRRPGVFILSEVRLYREGLAFCLSRQAGIAVLGAADHSAVALTQVNDLKPDVIVLDVAEPRSFEIAKTLRRHLPATKIIALAVSEDEQELLACAAAGFAGYVARDGSEADLVAAIENALRGELFCSPRMASLLFGQVAALSASGAPHAEPAILTQREQQILEFLGRGLSNKEIARELRIGNATVKNHVHHVLEKLQVRRRGEAAARLRELRHDVSSSAHPAVRERKSFAAEHRLSDRVD